MMRKTANLEALNKAVKQFGYPKIHHSDCGSQYVSEAYTSRLESCGIQISMCRTVLENAHAERVNGTIKNDYLRHFTNVHAHNIDRMALVAEQRYNIRFHDSLKMSPMEYEAWLLTTPKSKHTDLQVYTEMNTHKMNNHEQLSLFEVFN